MAAADPRVPGRAEDYFAVLLDRARRAELAGNYAIAAALVVHEPEGELVILGQNTVFADRDPAGHAEMNAIRAAQRVTAAAAGDRRALLAEGERDGWLLVRGDAGGGGEPGLELYATLEPCPMCTVCILNAGIDRVVVAVPDPPSGTLDPVRLAGLPTIWRALAAQVDVRWAQSGDPADGATHVPADLLDALLATFADSRSRLDDQLQGGGALDRGALAAAVSARLAPRPVG